MPEPYRIKEINGKIAIIASLIARHRGLLERRRAKGRDTEQFELTLEALVALHRHRLKILQLLQASSTKERIDQLGLE